MAWAKSGGFGGAAILHLTMTRLVLSSRLIKTIPIVTNLSIHSTLQNIELQNNFCVTLAGGARQSDRLSSIGLTGLPWSSRKNVWRIVRGTRADRPLYMNSANRTVRFTLNLPNSVSNGSVYFSLMSDGPSACHDRTVRATHLNCLTVFSGPTDTLSQPIRAAPIKPYDPNATYKGP